MGDGHEVDPLQLRDYADYVRHLSIHGFRRIRLVAQYEGCNPDGFTGLLTPLGEACTALQDSVVEPLFEMATEKLNGTAQGVMAAAEDYGLAEAEAEERLEQHQGPLGGDQFVV
ncbi:hypothetical protein [Haloechinothrix sp. LS1_15]|uniref:hypothetical protein n=1 Tax=Haloechinothrix sp. LS1_15 TaxID=2652248 RepID=UPI002946D0B6|nr:hypothetical protein [Haloechinothrix sp. LS1_15]MDV6013289.1 hypothetical protein [Haloechinothrix sp. LS1_15]